MHECQNCGSTEGPFVGCWDTWPEDDEDCEIMEFCEACAINLGYCGMCGRCMDPINTANHDLLDENGNCPPCRQNLIDVKYECSGEKSED